jgi:aryl-alcohol dehydrogenase-like predicted oxidoreductase
MKLALGTVQFGLNYGITNNLGQVQQSDVADILEYARIANINLLDTAASYGNCESVLGEQSTQKFDVVSKIPTVGTLKSPILQSITESLNKLKRSSLYGLMFHNEDDLISCTQNFKDLQTAKRNGLVHKIGCSFYTLDALKKSIDMNYDIDLIQIPANVLDQRFIKSGLLEEVKKRGIEIHCRSLFLQGLLLDRKMTLPKKLQPFKEDLSNFFNFCDFNNITPLMASLMSIKQASVIDYAVVGCVCKPQLQEIVIAYGKVNQLDRVIDFSQLASTNTVLLNPTLWN